MSALIALSEKDIQKPQYRDNQSGLNQSQVDKLLERSTTIYVGNLNFQTTEETIYSTFIDCGPIKRIIMGVNKITHEPCGFCFVEFFDRESTLNAVIAKGGIIIDGNVIRPDIDRGFEEGRQYGRGKSGGQIRDEARGGKDPSRPAPRRKNQRKRNY